MKGSFLLIIINKLILSVRREIGNIRSID